MHLKTKLYLIHLQSMCESVFSIYRIRGIKGHAVLCSQGVASVLLITIAFRFITDDIITCIVQVNKLECLSYLKKCIQYES